MDEKLVCDESARTTRQTSFSLIPENLACEMKKKTFFDRTSNSFTFIQFLFT